MVRLIIESKSTRERIMIKMKYYVLGWNCNEYVEMTMEEIQAQYGENILQGFDGCEVLVLTKMEKDALYFAYCEFEG
jgi:hypothetical protein